MDTTMTKRHVVMHYSSSFPKRVTFKDAREYDFDAQMPREVYTMRREAWEDIGSPKTITITIEPGDKLNDSSE